jgi:hypothetical protein
MGLRPGPGTVSLVLLLKGICGSGKNAAQRLKPLSSMAVYGTAKGVPFRG